MARTRTGDMALFAKWLKEVRGVATKTVDTYVSCIQRITNRFPDADADLVRDFIESTGSSKYLMRSAWKAYALWGAAEGKFVPFKEEDDTYPSVPPEVAAAIHTLRFGRDDGTTVAIKAAHFPLLFAHALSGKVGSSTVRQITFTLNHKVTMIALDAKAVETIMAWNGNDGSKRFPLVPAKPGVAVAMSEAQVNALVKAYRAGRMNKEDFGPFTPFHEWLVTVRAKKLSDASMQTKIVARIYEELGCPNEEQLKVFAARPENVQNIAVFFSAWHHFEQYVKVRAQALPGPSKHAVDAAVDVCLHGSPDGEIPPLPNLADLNHETAGLYSVHARYLQVIAAGSRTGWLPRAPLWADPGSLKRKESP